MICALFSQGNGEGENKRSSERASAHPPRSDRAENGESGALNVGADAAAEVVARQLPQERLPVRLPYHWPKECRLLRQHCEMRPGKPNGGAKGGGGTGRGGRWNLRVLELVCGDCGVTRRLVYCYFSWPDAKASATIYTHE